MKKDIITHEDVELLVNTFYGRIQEDELLGPIFNSKIEDRWPEHLKRMYSFWQSILLNENAYTGQPFLKHMNLGLEQEHFARWLYLFHTTVSEFFEGAVAEDAKKRSAQIAGTFYAKLQHIK